MWSLYALVCNVSAINILLPVSLVGGCANAEEKDLTYMWTCLGHQKVTYDVK